MHRSLFAIMLLAALAITLPAAAHHPTGGMTPDNFLNGFLSGLGHPLLGADHLAFLLAAGLAAGIARLSLLVPAAFVVTSLVGVGLHANGMDIPAAEVLVACSVALAGALLLRGQRGTASPWLVLAALAGMVHGYAYGETVVGAEATPVTAYLLGLALLQGAMVTGVALGIRHAEAAVQRLVPRYAGAAVVAVGVVTLLTRALPWG